MVNIASLVSNRQVSGHCKNLQQPTTMLLKCRDLALRVNEGEETFQCQKLTALYEEFTEMEGDREHFTEKEEDYMRNKIEKEEEKLEELLDAKDCLRMSVTADEFEEGYEAGRIFDDEDEVGSRPVKRQNVIQPIEVGTRLTRVFR